MGNNTDHPADATEMIVTDADRAAAKEITDQYFEVIRKSCVDTINEDEFSARKREGLAWTEKRIARAMNPDRRGLIRALLEAELTLNLMSCIINAEGNRPEWAEMAKEGSDRAKAVLVMIPKALVRAEEIEIHGKCVSCGGLGDGYTEDDQLICEECAKSLEDIEGADNA